MPDNNFRQRQTAESPGIDTGYEKDLVTVFFIPDALRNDAGQMLSGLHLAFLALGAFTIFSSLIFHRLKKEDGADETRPKTSPLAESPVLVAASPGTKVSGR